ncbi:lipoprotein NlpI [Anatilimnocola aggregata]|uniref:Lipoprotein NlpI n=1 Tax=Anatilimnocola aggregata TaxID=2528021 RepID=A0A517YKT0_9BACT|nr:tetratricopeptide repeat protein [Anatilimnocola aggregata]QDU30832.1 lipoprotein NlpI [Anatilimnocola aggregata]
MSKRLRQPIRPATSRVGSLPRRDTCNWCDLAAIACIVAAGALAYANSFEGAFVFDDIGSIVENSTIRDLTDLPAIFWSPPRGGTTTDGRPILNLSLALNYAIHGLDVQGYHALNLALHIGNALLIWLILLEVFNSPQIPERLRSLQRTLAFSVALLWVVHPLTTAAVTYTVQRAEVLMATFYLLTMFCFLRGCRAKQAKYRWFIAATVLCLIGQGTKEVAATAPLALLLIDVAVVSGSWAETFRARRFWHTLNFLTLLGTVAVVISQGGRSGTIEVERHADRWAYLFLQTQHLLNYVRLCFWPAPLVFDYGDVIPALDWSQVPAFLLVSAIGLLFVWLFWRNPVAGLPGVLFFVILAPTSSFVPVATQVAAIHRMYLPLMLVLTGCATLVATALTLRTEQQAPNVDGAARHSEQWLIALTCCLAVVLGMLTFARNEAFRNAQSLWQDTVLKVPTNVRACSALAKARLEDGQTEGITSIFSAAVASPRAVDALVARAEMLASLNQFDLAEQDCRAALKLDPRSDQAYNSLGVIAFIRGENAQAMEYFDEAIRLFPRAETYLRNRGNLFVRLEQLSAARRDYNAALAVRPSDTESHFLLALLDYKEGRLQSAAVGFRLATYYNANYQKAQQSLAVVEEELRRGGAASPTP